MHETILDQATDTGGHELYRLTQLYDLPEYVKTASDSDRMGTNITPTNAYADYRRPRRFPCHTKAATLTSWAFFLQQRGKMHSKEAQGIEHRLQQMANFHHIEDDVQKLLQKHAALSVDSLSLLPDSAFAVVRTDENGATTERHYPLRHGAEVKAAADWLLQYRDSFPFRERVTIAEKILEKAAEFGVNLGEQYDVLERQAGHGWCTAQDAAALIRGRALLTSADSDFRAQLGKLAATTEKQAEYTMYGNNLADLGELIDNFDKLARVKYSEHLPRPEDILYRIPYKAAEELRDSICSTLTGSVYDQQQFEKLSISAIRDLFGRAVADEVFNGLGVDGEKFAAVAKTFPRPDAEMLDGLMAEIGQQPIARE